MLAFRLQLLVLQACARHYMNLTLLLCDSTAYQHPRGGIAPGQNPPGAGGTHGRHAPAAAQ